MTITTKRVGFVAGVMLASACTSDVSGDGTGPNLGRSSLIATFHSGSHVETIATDADAVYWIENAGLYRCLKAGCSLQPTGLAVTTVDGSSRQPSSGPFVGAASLVVGGSLVYWSTNDGNNLRIYACPTTGCPGGPQVIANLSSTGVMPMLRADADGVYFAGENRGPVATLLTCASAGCGGSPKVLAEAVNGNGPQLLFALSAGRLYFWNPSNNGGAPAALPFGLLSCPTAGCSTDVRVHYASAAPTGNAPSSQATVLAADDAAVYLSVSSSTSGGNALSRCELPACNGKLQTLVPAAQSGNFLNTPNGSPRVDQTSDTLYALTTQCSGSGPCSTAPTLVACAKVGCLQGPTTFQPDVSFPLSNNGNGASGASGLAVQVDGSGIYWTGVPSYYEGGRFLLRSPLMPK